MENEHSAEIHIPEYSSDSHDIIITNFINPHLFWYRYQSRYHHHEHLKKVTKDIEDYITSGNLLKKHYNGYAPKLNEIVLFKHFASFNYIRGIIDKIIDRDFDGEPTYFIWCIDYGVPMQAKTSWILPISENLANEKSYIYFGGIANVLPGEMKYNYEECSKNTMVSTSWSEYTLKHFDTEILNAAAVKFLPQYIIGNNPLNLHYYGQMTITTYDSTNNSYNIMDKLFNVGHAIKSNNFLNDIKFCDSIGIKRWQNNNKNTVAICSSTTNPIANTFGQLKKPEKFENSKRNRYHHRNAGSIISDETINAKIDDWVVRNGLHASNDIISDDEHYLDDNEFTFCDSASVIVNENNFASQKQPYNTTTNENCRGNNKPLRFVQEDKINKDQIHKNKRIVSKPVKDTTMDENGTYVVQGEIGLAAARHEQLIEKLKNQRTNDGQSDDNKDQDNNKNKPSSVPQRIQTTNHIESDIKINDTTGISQQIKGMSLRERIANIRKNSSVQKPPVQKQILFPADMNKAVVDQYLNKINYK